MAVAADRYQPLLEALSHIIHLVGERSLINIEHFMNVKFSSAPQSQQLPKMYSIGYIFGTMVVLPSLNVRDAYGTFSQQVVSTM